MLLGLLAGLGYIYGFYGFWVAVAAVLVINIVMWLVSPKISDLTYGFFFDMNWVTLEELRDQSPETAETIERVCEEENIDKPKLGLIHDSNPQAFTYGSDHWNARVIATEGIFEYLDDNEISSVYAHEMGHIAHRDFIVMTIANTMIQLLYLIASRAWHWGSGDSDVIGRYLMYYLSRIREYYADQFSGRYTDPNYLSSALIKISYGILDSPDDEELVKTTESMGIMNINQGEEKGAIYYQERNLQDHDLLGKAFMFDLVNPWAKLSELSSTHPLTGKRIRALSKQTKKPIIDFEQLMSEYTVDKSRLYGMFAIDLFFWILPLLTLIAGGAAGFLIQENTQPGLMAAGTALIGYGLGRSTKFLYKFNRTEEKGEVRVIDLLGDIYASPMRGKFAKLKGEIVGRGEAGFSLSPNLMLQDRTGLMYLRFKSIVPVIGDLWFGWRHAGDWEDRQAEVEGWYFRRVRPWIGLKSLESAGDSKKSFVHVAPHLVSLLAVAIGVAVVYTVLTGSVPV